MRTNLLAFLFSLLIMPFAKAQFAPQVGVPGSTAIHKTSSLIKSWATECTIRRGFQNIADKSLGYTLLGDSTNVLGIADGEIVSLGDSGIATIKFRQPIFNGDGADFAVFENGFQNPANPEEAFLELAFVAVSSDGENFFTFPTTSNTPSSTQIKGVGEYMNARLINNFAGKYIGQNGTPFDLEELKSTPGLDVNNISHIRIIDVIGAISGHTSSDHLGQIINDPYPTPFSTGGFDLDAVAAINITGTNLNEIKISDANIFPNPASAKVFVTLKSESIIESEIVLTDLAGKIILRQKAEKSTEINISDFMPGLYFIGISNSTGIQWIGKCSKI